MFPEPARARRYAWDVLNERVRPIIEPFTTGAGRVLARAHLGPNTLTTIGLGGTLLASWFVIAGHPGTAAYVLIPSVIVDVLDGATARAMGRVTRWGGFYDSVCDRIGDGAVLGAIAWEARARDDGLVAAALIALVLTELVPYARAKAESLGVTVAGGPGERAERVVILIGGLILGYVEAVVWIIAALTAFTLVVRVLSVWRNADR